MIEVNYRKVRLKDISFSEYLKLSQKTKDIYDVWFGSDLMYDVNDQQNPKHVRVQRYKCLATQFYIDIDYVENVDEKEQKNE